MEEMEEMELGKNAYTFGYPKFSAKLTNFPCVRNTRFQRPGWEQ